MFSLKKRQLRGKIIIYKYLRVCHVGFPLESALVKMWEGKLPTSSKCQNEVSGLEWTA